MSSMKRYEMNKQKEGSITYFFIRDTETWDIVLLPTKYLMHMTKAKCSPNTVRRSGCSILYYLEYIKEKEKKLTDVYEMSFTEQTKYFVEFLYWLKAGKHTSGKMNILPNNGTCNAYLKDVFRFYVFIEEEFSQFGGLKVLSYSQFTAVDSVGLKKTIRSRSFKGYLKEEEHKARTAKKDEIIEILKACTNIRDRLLILLLAETGYRIGEILGINYMNDIDYSNQVIRVYFREDNENGARAKNAEYRSAKISADTFQFLNCYIAEYRKILQHQSYLFVNISGRTVGNPLTVDAVYAMLKRMEKKTGIKITPHMLRHYFGNERRKAGWALELIQIAYGHRHIQTTINYLDIVDDELLEASQEFYKKNTALYGIDELL
ncbi:Tyrosine recombinase XerD [Dorea formicigenerans]|uniref:Tyrosine recombinase XerD n=2 Tax=Dorea formicigenerans TaxID=39486 RepID=A0A564SYI5_9FIRM|nr:Tyrosine recombinase XerD [Dorea formicigenerans]